jgi:cell division inhibitor SepF
MASVWKKTMLYLGLGPDDEYDDDEMPAPAQQVQAREPAPVASTRQPPARPRPAAPRQTANLSQGPEEGASVRTLPAAGSDAPAVKPRPAVRPVPATPSAKPHVVSPTSFNQAQDVADKFKASQPVILNLQGVDRDLARRLIDFSSGLCYGLGGHMEKVAHQVYLLTPTNVELSAEERRRLQERGLHDG